MCRATGRVMIYIGAFVGLSSLRILNAQRIYYVVLIALFMFCALRFEVGCDWSGYLNQFYVYKSVAFDELLKEPEPFWVGLFVLQDYLGLPYPWINIFSAAIFFGGVHLLARRQPDPLAFLILLFPILIINIAMSGIRQAAATGVLCISFIAFIDRKLVRFVLLTLLAAALHSSAAVFLLLAPLIHGAYSKTRLVLSGLVAIPVALALLSTEAARTAMGRYLGTGFDAFGAQYRAALLVLTAIFFFMFLRRKWARSFPNDYKLVVIGSLMMLAAGVLVPVSSVIGDRLGYYLVPVQTMIFARLPFLPLAANRRLIIAAPYLGLLLVLAVWTSLSALFLQCYVPYQTWLFGFPESRYGL